MTAHTSNVIPAMTPNMTAQNNPSEDPKHVGSNERLKRATVMTAQRSINDDGSNEQNEHSTSQNKKSRTEKTYEQL